MKKTIEITLLPEQCFDEKVAEFYISRNINSTEISGIKILRKSLDARRKPIRYNLQVDVYFNETPPKEHFDFDFKDVRNATHAVIIGAGPAGLFAALKLLEQGIKPIIFERGKDVRERRRELAKINRENTVNPESNYCFGEGGAGTFSDGKLYTRSTKRGDVNAVLKTFVAHGATEDILVDARPHIGTNKLPQIITSITESILNAGGEIRFDTKVTS